MPTAPSPFTLDKDIAVPVRDGTVLRADVFRPSSPGRYPVIMTHGPYGKDIHFEDFNAGAYSIIDEHGPYMNWETVNPEWWVPQGYVVIRVDQRGTGHSPGRMALIGRQEWEDHYDAIEWAGVQTWSNGNVGLLGISYYAIGQWHVAAMQPPHLSAIVPWEGAVDIYRDWSHHGGILSNGFADDWWPRQITGNQSALPPGADNPGKAVDGNADLLQEFRDHSLFDAYYADRQADLTRIRVPVLSAGNWTSYALHLRGNIEGFMGAGTQHKWLEIHDGNHFTPFYTEEGRLYQKRFLDCWLKGDQRAWHDEPPVKLFIRDSHGGGQFRAESAWPLERTQWTTFYLDAHSGRLDTQSPEQPGSVSYPAPEGSATFLTAPFKEDVEVTGPSALHVWVAADAEDMDLFVTLINIDANGKEVTFEDASGIGNRGPVVKGWLRVSHRALDEARSLPYRPFHAHTERELLEPNEPVLASVEIMPTSMVFAEGHRLGVVIQAADRNDPTRFLHNDPQDRAETLFRGTNTVHTGGDMDSYLLLPVIPATD
ncbi:CocE/NonD family hydrolase [Streptomyces luteolifulvus]|uniref:CocE/NonD family hydrolase n=1 Tax=Streptomyces luteolifulvus TaxID=2615112 RepID=A0A6H9UPB4_9ACTN|nr:CocE/NonD family hydrolase [Streptomyces luteolifulvus]KAB1139652.1 CocE/NonD family hydrolase [Streptomyces luteolifulvus]